MTEFASLPITKFQQRWAKVQAAREIARTSLEYYQLYKKRTAPKPPVARYVVSVEESDDLFDDIMDLLMSSSSSEDQRNVKAEVSSQYDSVVGEHRYHLTLSMDGKYETHLDIDNFKVPVQVTSTPITAKNDDENSEDTWIDKLLSGDNSSNTKPDDDNEKSKMTSWRTRISFMCHNLAMRDAVIAKLNELTNAMNTGSDRPIRLYVSDSGRWVHRSAMNKRPLDSVILAAGQKEAMVQDFEYFVSTEARYIELGLPWHRGYLFHGPPGTGKTSLATAIATHFRMHVYFISLSSVQDDAQLLSLVNQIDAERAMLVLEDIDIAHASRERDDTQKGITLNGMLNALDGVATPHGLVTVMTTNARDVLDPALVRPGRVDHEVHISYVDDDQLKAIVERFHGRSLDLPSIIGKVTPAEVIGLFKVIHTDEELTHLLADLIERRNAGEEPGEITLNPIRRSSPTSVLEGYATLLDDYGSSPQPPRPKRSRG